MHERKARQSYGRRHEQRECIGGRQPGVAGEEDGVERKGPGRLPGERESECEQPQVASDGQSRDALRRDGAEAAAVDLAAAQQDGGHGDGEHREHESDEAGDDLQAETQEECASCENLRSREQFCDGLDEAAGQQAVPLDRLRELAPARKLRKPGEQKETAEDEASDHSCWFRYFPPTAADRYSAAV